MKLYTYWRSQASFRVRVALRLKGLVAETISLDLLKGDQFDPIYRVLNPEMVVPTLLDGDGPPLVQSLAILEYLGSNQRAGDFSSQSLSSHAA
jgi:maleylacetoacetate isomerase